MAVRSVVPVNIQSRNNRELPSTRGQMNLVEWNKEERLKNAAKTLGLFFGLTCFAVMIPVVHYFLVPVLFVTTFVMAMDKYSHTKTYESGSGPCPKCGEVVLIDKTKFKERITDSCGKCHEDVEIVAAG